MVKELAQERYSCGMSGIVPVNELKIGIRYQCYRTRSQIVGCIQNPISSIELDKRASRTASVGGASGGK